MKDSYIHDMVWCINAGGFHLPHYRLYQYDLIKKYLGKDILEVGTGDREFTRLIEAQHKGLSNCVSIEPSKSFFKAFKHERFSKKFIFLQKDLFAIENTFNHSFDTVLFIHVLEHIKDDKKAIHEAYNLLRSGGRVLIIVPANPWLFSDHDRSLGHYRRYSKSMLEHIADPDEFIIEDIWYQDALGMLGSLLFFKLQNITLKSSKGEKLLHGNGVIYDTIVIPIERFIERYIRFPFGLTLTMILRKHNV